MQFFLEKEILPIKLHIYSSRSIDAYAFTVGRSDGVMSKKCSDICSPQINPKEQPKIAQTSKHSSSGKYVIA